MRLDTDYLNGLSFREIAKTGYEVFMHPETFLEHALACDELDRFLLGEAPWFQVARSDNDEPQNVMAAFDQQVLHYWREHRDARFPGQLVKALCDVLTDCADRSKAIYVVSDWVWYYGYCRSKQHAQPGSEYTDLFELDLEPVGAMLKQQLQANKALLIADTRWAGSPWNSQSGLWEPLMRTALNVRDTLGGPDFVPVNI
ncbi:hypothetical protein ACIPL1_19545 [Pseudomonas sp. NPDC090202]|uniref:hypothetical protein n=1 Tax=unclassified Pseudomonas TaxID=196821 RepID=UPI0037FDEB6B